MYIQGSVKEAAVMNSSIKIRLESIFRDIFGDDTICLTAETNAEDIEGWDSLKHISIMAAIQDEFSVSFDMDEIMKMNNVGEMADAIEGKLR